MKKLLILLLLLPTLASAAGFDCSKAKSPTEQRICADPVLTKMDLELGNAYEQVLKSTDTADAWKADQRAWLAERNRCAGDNGCLRQQYAERLTVLRAGSQPFQWDAHWWRVDSSGMSASELVIREVTKGGFEFEVSAWAGANSGELLGKASLATDGTACYVGDADSDTEGCVLTFKRVLNHLEVDQKGDAPTCGAGLNVFYDGTYVAADRDPNAKPDLISRGVLPSRELDGTFRAMVGKDYDKFVETADVVGANDEKLNGNPVTVVGMFVRGVACYTKSMIVYDARGHQWAALWTVPDASASKVEVRYYTNVAGDKHTLPALIASQREACPGDTVQVRMMP
jgi:uncharacterized protein